MEAITEKRCPACQLVKPASEYYRSSKVKSGLSSYCKKCSRSQAHKWWKANSSFKLEINRKWARNHPEKKRAANTAYRSRNREYFKQWARVYRMSKLMELGKIHENPPMCEIHGQHSEWKHTPYKTRWWCQKCTAENRRVQERTAQLQSRINYFEHRYGPKLAMEYRSILPSLGPDAIHGKALLRYILVEFVKRETGMEIDKEQAERIASLNRISGKEMLNIGWECKQCGVSHRHWHMFDIDHITPRAAGGSNKRHNLQILCPTCHRIKTMAEAKNLRSARAVPQELDVGVPDQGIAPSLINTSTPESLPASVAA